MVSMGLLLGGISSVCLSFLSKASILLLFLQHLILFWSLLTSSRPAALRSSVLSTRAVGPKPQPHSSSEQSLLQAFWLDLDGFGPFGSWSKWTKGRCHSKKLSHATSADLIEDTYSYFVPIHSNFRYLHLERVKCMGNSDPQIFELLLSQQFVFLPPLFKPRVQVQRISIDAWQRDRSFGLLCRRGDWTKQMWIVIAKISESQGVGERICIDAKSLLSWSLVGLDLSRALRGLKTHEIQINKKTYGETRCCTNIFRINHKAGTPCRSWSVLGPWVSSFVPLHRNFAMLECNVRYFHAVMFTVA